MSTVETPSQAPSPADLDGAGDGGTPDRSAADGRPVLGVRAKARGDFERIYELLRGQIASGALGEGDRLPTERELVRRFSASRSTVRKALRSLEDQKVIQRQTGRGTFVTGPLPAGAGVIRPAPAPATLLGPGFDADEIAAFSPADVVECRLLIEPALAPLAVARASPADVRRMEECLRHADAAADVPAFEHWDEQFHDAIARATRNPAALAITRSLAQVRKRAEWGKIKESTVTVERKVRLQQEHYRILDGIRRRDGDAASRAMRDHLLHVRGYMFGGAL
jgi:DNA-binding FadR family transcriptional regulator